MKRKELKNFAHKIAALEYELQKSTDSDQKKKLQEQIMFTTNHMVSRGVKVPDDLLEIDCMVQEILEKEYES